MHAHKATAFARRAGGQQGLTCRTLPTVLLLLLGLVSTFAVDEAMLRALHADGTCIRPSGVSVNQSAAYAELSKKYRKVITYGSGGRAPLRSFLRHRAAEAGSALILEVGVFLGVSLAEWLAVGDAVFAIGIDPFNSDSSLLSAAIKKQHLTHDETLHAALTQVFGEPPGPIGLANYIASTGAENAAGRYCLIRGLAPEDLEPLMSNSKLHAAVQPDLIYIDGGKVSDVEKHKQYIQYSMALYRHRYPQAAFAGDDWIHHLTPYLPQILTAIAQKGQYHLGVASNRTWFMGAPSSLGLWGLPEGCYNASSPTVKRSTKSAAHGCNIEWVVPPTRALVQ